MTKANWYRITTALNLYIDLETENLSSQNCGDREWTELNDYKSLVKDIELHITTL